jgi:hypothetical protein
VPALFQPSPILQAQRLSVRLSTLKHGRSQRVPSSRPTPRRSTPIRTMVLAFVVRLDADGVRELQVVG